MKDHPLMASEGLALPGEDYGGRRLWTSLESENGGTYVHEKWNGVGEGDEMFLDSDPCLEGSESGRENVWKTAPS